MYMYMYICAWSYDLNMYNEPLFKDQVYFGHTLWPWMVYQGTCFFLNVGPRGTPISGDLQFVMMMMIF